MKKKINILVIPPDYYGVSYYRLINPYLEIQKAAPEDFHIEINQKVNFNDSDYLKKFDIIHGHRTFVDFQQMDRLVAHLKELGIITILDIDDFWTTGKNHPMYHIVKKQDLDKKVPKALSLVDYVTTTTEWFANVIKNHNKNVVVFPNAVDPNHKNFILKKEENNSGRLKFGYLGGSCYDKETEILTDEGFKFFENLTGTEKVATLNPDSNELEFIKPDHYLKEKFVGQLFLGESKNINFAVTPNHNMYVTPLNSLHKKKNNYTLIPMEELNDKNLQFKKDCKWSGVNEEFFILPEYQTIFKQNGSDRKLELKKEKEILMSDWIKFFGFWIAEGWTSNSKNLYQVGIAQKKNNGVLSEMFELLVKMGFNPTYTKDKYQVRVFDRQLWTYLSQFGKAHEKFIPKEILNLKTEYLESWLKYYLIGDGNVCKKTGKTVCYTASAKLADNLIELALKIGSAGKLTNRGIRNSIMVDGRLVNGKYDSLEVCIQKKDGIKNQLNPVMRKEKITRIDYDDYVYCVSVPNHIIYVRRNGKSMWCGNSHLADLNILDKSFEKINKKYADKVQWVLCGFDIRGTVSELNEKTGDIKERPILPSETCWAKYEELMTSDYKYLSEDYKSWLLRFKDDNYTDEQNLMYRRVWTKPFSTYATNYNLMDVSLAPLKTDDGLFNTAKSQLKVIEAGFHKMPIIASDIAPYKIDIIHGVNGFLVKNNSGIKGWDYYMEYFLKHPEKVKEMGEALYQTVKDKYNIKNVSASRAEWLRSIINK